MAQDDSVLRAVLQKVPENRKEIGMTVLEIGRELGWSKGQVCAKLRLLKEQGVLGVHRKIVLDISGQRRWVPSYTVLKPKKKAK